MTRVAKIPAIEVAIPFSGDPASFQFSPSRYSLPSHDCEVRNDHLVITLSDDDQVQSRVDQFVQQVAQNLETLRAEVSAWVPRFRAELERAAAARKAQFEDQDKRDKNLRFKVT